MVFRFNRIQIPEEHWELYIAEQNAFNFRHMKNVTFLMNLIIGVLLLQHILFPRNDEQQVYITEYISIFSCLLLAGLLFLIVPKIIKIKLSETSRKKLLVAYLYLLSFLFMGLTYFDLHFGLELSAYIIVLMFLSMVIWFDQREFGLIASFVFFLLIISFLILSSFQGLQVYQFIQGLIYYMLSWVLFYSICHVRIENFLNRITMEQQYDMLATESATDPLTGLYNRRHLKDDLQQEFARSERSDTNFCIVLLDLDHFKKINDSYGHIAGDEVLKELAIILRNSVRLSDRVFRYGGEEFMILLPETKDHDANILAERIRQKVENFSFTGIRRKITISLGIAQSRRETPQELIIQIADKRLYQAKQKGRNQVVWKD